MRKFFVGLGLLLSVAAYAHDVEVSGQFVVAPFVSVDCVAEGLTEPTFGLTVECELLEMLAFFAYSPSNNAAGMNDVLVSDPDEPACPAGIYSLDGRKRTSLTRGVNIVVNEDGSSRKIVVR